LSFDTVHFQAIVHRSPSLLIQLRLIKDMHVSASQILQAFSLWSCFWRW